MSFSLVTIRLTGRGYFWIRGACTALRRVIQLASRRAEVFKGFQRPGSDRSHAASRPSRAFHDQQAPAADSLIAFGSSLAADAPPVRRPKSPASLLDASACA